MVVYCFIEGCKSTKYKSAKEDNKILLTFFGFPTNPVLREKWVEALITSGHSREHVARISKSSRICSLHFSKDYIETIGFSSSRLKPNSVPTIFPNAPKGRMADIENAGPSNMPPMEIETVAQYEDEICRTPSKKRVYYAGDIKSGNIENMTPRTLVKSLNILKKSCEKKDKIINRLRVQYNRQKKKIASLENLHATWTRFWATGDLNYSAMPYICCASKCFNKSDQGYALVRFPKEDSYRKAWLNAALNENVSGRTLENLRLCEVHFKPSDILVVGNRKEVKKDVIPSRFCRCPSAVLQASSAYDFYSNRNLYTEHSYSKIGSYFLQCDT